MRRIAQLEVEGEVGIAFLRRLGSHSHSGGVDGVFDSDSSGRAGQIHSFEVTAIDCGHGCSDFAAVFVDVFNVGVRDLESALAISANVDGVVSATDIYSQSRGAACLRRVAQLEVEGQVRIPLLRSFSSDGHSRGIDGVFDGNSGGRAGQIDGFEVTAIDRSDGRSDFTAVFVDVFDVGVRDLEGALAIGANVDGVVSATDIYSQSRGAAGLRRVAQLEVEGEVGITFLRRYSCYSNSGGVDGVFDGDGGGCTIQVNCLEVTAAHFCDGRGDFAWVDVDVSTVGVWYQQGTFARRIDINGVIGATDINGQGGAAASLRRVAQLEVERQVAITFLRRYSCYSNSGGVDGVFDSDGGGCTTQVNCLEVTAVHFCDGRSDFAWVDVDISAVGVWHQ
ncbi:hypothetical protein PS623_04507 [Pseudomonas fluorescens]|nr:hypothetical protein PS623_04507 [Pseudomonas fluorescens]